jgi:hypothetical protein
MAGDAADFGPKMLALNERKRAFILHYLVQGCTNGAEASRAAGYSDEAGGAKVRAPSCCTRMRCSTRYASRRATTCATYSRSPS